MLRALRREDIVRECGDSQCAVFIWSLLGTRWEFDFSRVEILRNNKEKVRVNEYAYG